MSDPAKPAFLLRVTAAPVGQSPSLQTIALGGTAVSIGRSEDNDLVLPDPLALVSRRHCRIVPSGGLWQLEDTSTNGTIVNDAPVSRGRTMPLQPGDTIRMGDYVLTVEATAPAAGAAEAAEPLPPADPVGVGDLARRDAADQLGERGGPAIPPDANLFEDLSRPDEPLRGAPPGPFDEPWRAAPEPVQPAADGPAPFDVHAVPIPRADNALGQGGLPDDWMEPVPASQSRAAPATPPAALAEPSPAVASDALLQAYLSGAGLERLPAGLEPAAAMHALGEASRTMLGTLARLLAARRAIKGEFRVAQTVIEARDNNPLKFSTDEREMLQILLGAVRPGFLGGLAALEDACRDLEAHQLSLLAGFRAALDLLLQRLSPEAIASSAKGGLLGGKAKQWERFEAVHAELRRDVANNFAGQLGQAFTAAYEAEAKRRG